MPKTVLVVPCFNEEKRLERDVFLAWGDAHPDVQFLMVNDGSSDGTRAMLDELAAKRPGKFHALQLEKNGGKAEAVRAGMLHALRTMEPDFVGFWDADLATPLEALPEFIDVLTRQADVEVVMGSRVQLLGRQIERNRGRHYFGRVAATAVSVMLGIPVYDTQCGAKVFRATATLPTILAEPFITRWVFDVEILARWILLKQDESRAQLARHVVELPLREWRDVKGTRLKPTDFMKAPMELARIWRHYFGK